MNKELRIRGCYKRVVFLILNSLFLILFISPLPALADEPAAPVSTGISGFTTIVPGANDAPDSVLGKKYATGDYTLCDFLRLFGNIVQVLFELAAGAALLLFLWTAFGMISNWGDAEKAAGAFKGLKNIFYGLAIMLGAWFLVNSVVAVLSGTIENPHSGPNQPALVGAIFGKPWSNLEEICKDL